jgi:hypothetical protein
MKRTPLLVLAATTTAVATGSLLFAAEGADEAVSPIYFPENRFALSRSCS